MSILQIEPLPTPERFDQAYIEVNNEINGGGGIQLFLAQRALLASIDEAALFEDRLIAQYGIRFIDPALDPEDDDSYAACYAYINGYMATGKVMDRVFESPHTFMNRFSPVASWFEQADLTSVQDLDDRAERERKVLEEFGVYGLRHLGARAVGVLTDWANVAYPDHERLTAAFNIGSGTMVSGAILYQRSLNAHLTSVMGQERDLDAEFASLLRGEGA